MNRCSLRIIFCLFYTGFLFKVEAQYSTATPDSSSFARLKESAISSAKNVIESKLLDKQLAERFFADSSSSLIICEDYKTFFNSYTVWCSPVGYEIALYVILETGNTQDTVHTNLFLPLDSAFRFKDSLTDKWHDSLLRAWEKVVANKYKVNYAEVLQFVKQKRLQQYSIDFGYEGSGYKPNSEVFWFVTAAVGKGKSKRSFLYRINSETGAIKLNVRKVKPTKFLRDVS